MKMDDRKSIPIAKPDLNGCEEQYVLKALRSTWISSSGEFLDSFEEEFATLCDAGTAIGVCNGTIALHLALLALDVRPGDEVLVPSLTYIATANAVRYVGAEPVFVDVDPTTWCIDPDKLEEQITPRTRGIIGVHLYGHPADMDRINHLAAIHGLWVVEDAAEAHTARYKNRLVGSLAKVATFSFFGNKILTSGEGGALTLNDPQLAKRMRALRGQGMDPQRRYYFPIVGYNFRMTNIAAAILCAQIERVDELLGRRKAICEQYRSLLDGVPGIGFQPKASWADPAPWMFCLTVDTEEFGMSRDELISYLGKRKVETRPFFIPLHTMPPYRESSQARHTDLPITDQLSRVGMNLPTYSGLQESEVEFIATSIHQAHRTTLTRGVRLRAA